MFLYALVSKAKRKRMVSIALNKKGDEEEWRVIVHMRQTIAGNIPAFFFFPTLSLNKWKAYILNQLRAVKLD